MRDSAHFSNGRKTIRGPRVDLRAPSRTNSSALTRCDAVIRTAQTMKAFNKGEHVKLTARFAAAIARNRRGKLAYWTTRKGVVQNINSYNVYVIWEGNKGKEMLPIKAVERVA